MDLERDDDRPPSATGLALGLTLAAVGATLLVFAYCIVVTIGQLVGSL